MDKTTEGIRFQVRLLMPSNTTLNKSNVLPTSGPFILTITDTSPIWAGILIYRIISNASRPADLSRLRWNSNGISIVTTRLASRPAAAITALLAARDDLPRGNGGRATGIASLRTGQFTLGIVSQDLPIKKDGIRKKDVTVTGPLCPSLLSLYESSWLKG